MIYKGFFNTARTAGEVIRYLERKGIDYSAREISVILYYLMQRGMLDREKNAQGRYEYIAQ